MQSNKRHILTTIAAALLRAALPFTPATAATPGQRPRRSAGQDHSVWRPVGLSVLWPTGHWTRLSPSSRILANPNINENHMNKNSISGLRAASIVKTLCGALLSFAVVAFGAQAQSWPDKPVTLIVPYPAGSPTDAYVRGVAEGLSRAWKQPVVIDNRPGANEAIAVSSVTRAANNGYTLLAATEGGLLLNPLLHRKLSHNPDTQLVPISLLIKGPLVLSVPATFPAANLKEFLAYAKTRSSDPVRYGTPGLGGTIHLSFSALEKEQKVTLTHVPYKGNNLVLQDILGGHIEAGALAPSLVEPFIKNGKIKGLAVSSERRLVSLPDVPTFAELGVSDMNAVYFIALAAPAGTSQEIIQKIAQDSKTVVTSQAFKDRFADPVGLVTVASTPAEFTQYLKTERIAQQKRVVASGVAIED